jgi:hypothetical protein
MILVPKCLTQRTITAALFFTFAGTLLSQNVGSSEQSSTISPNLIASASLPSSWDGLLSHSSRNATSQDLLGKETATPSIGIPSATPTTQAFPLPATSSNRIPMPDPNTIASVQDTTKSHNSMISIGPGVLPLNARLDPNATQRYGVAPAVVQIHFGHK